MGENRTTDGRKRGRRTFLKAGALTERNINVRGGSTIEGAFDLLGAALSGRGGGSALKPVISEKESKKEENFSGFRTIAEADAFMKDYVEGKA